MIAINGYLHNLVQLISRQVHTHNYGKKDFVAEKYCFQ